MKELVISAGPSALHKAAIKALRNAPVQVTKEGEYWVDVSRRLPYAVSPGVIEQTMAELREMVARALCERGIEAHLGAARPARRRGDVVVSVTVTTPAVGRALEIESAAEVVEAAEKARQAVEQIREASNR